MRAGTFTPFGKPPYLVHLYSGGNQLLPPGNFIIDTGRVTVVQTFDWSQYIWRTVARPLTKFMVVDSDGTNYRLQNMSGVINGALITNAGSGGTNGIGPAQTSCTISFGSAPSNGRAAAGYCIVGGSITATVTISNAGTGYLVPPLLVIDPPPQGGIQATGYCTLSSGTIGAVTITNVGAGYKTAPNITVVPQFGSYVGGNLVDTSGTTAVTAPTLYPALTPYSTAYTATTQMSLPSVLDEISGNLVGAGSGASLVLATTTLTGSGTLTGIVMTDYGNNYTSVPSITFSGAGAPTSAAATALGSFSVTSVTLGSAGTTVTVAPGWQTSLGLVSNNDGCNDYYGARPASGISTLSSTTTTILTSFTVEDPGFGLQAVPNVYILPRGNTVYGANPTGTAVLGGLADTSIVQRAGS